MEDKDKDKDKDKTINFQLTIKNGVILAIFLAIISCVISILGNVGYNEWLRFREQKKTKKQENTFLLIGAASTYHLLEQKGCIDKINHNPTFINCATDDAFSFLKGVSQYKQQNFSYIILTARQGKKSDFFDHTFGRNLMQEFLDKGDRIVECKFEEKDSLMVYIGIEDFTVPKQQSLSIKAITNIIEEQNQKKPINIYMPHGNATWRTYKTLFEIEGKDSLIDNNKINRFEQNTKSVFTYPYIILSCKYFPTNVHSKPYYVKKTDKDKNLEYKDLFFYFIVESKKDEKSQVDDVVKKFYKEIYNKNFKIENYKEDSDRGNVVLIKK